MWQLCFNWLCREFKYYPQEWATTQKEWSLNQSSTSFIWYDITDTYFFQHIAGCVWYIWRLQWCYLSYVKWTMKWAKSLKNTMASCCAPWKTHFVLFMASVVLPTELFVGLCCVIYLSCQCNTNITNQNMTWSMTFLETCTYWSPVTRESLTLAW